MTNVYELAQQNRMLFINNLHNGIKEIKAEFGKQFKKDIMDNRTLFLSNLYKDVKEANDLFGCCNWFTYSTEHVGIKKSALVLVKRACVRNAHKRNAKLLSKADCHILLKIDQGMDDMHNLFNKFLMNEHIDVMQWLDKDDAVTLFNGSNPAVIEVEMGIWYKYFEKSDDKSGILWDILFMYKAQQCNTTKYKVNMSPFGTDKQEEVTLLMQSNDVGDGLRVSLA